MILLRKFLLIEGVEAGGQNTGQPGATQEVGGEEQSPHQHRVEGKHRVNVEKDGLHPGLNMEKVKYMEYIYGSCNFIIYINLFFANVG